MAVSNRIVTRTPIIIANSTYSPATANNLGTRTHQINCTDLASGAAQQSAKFDFGEDWSIEHILGAAIEWETSPEVTNTDTVDLYIGYSHSATVGTANPGGITGVALAPPTFYTGYANGGLEASLLQLEKIGTFFCDNIINSDEVQIVTAITKEGRGFVPLARYGTLVVMNRATTNSAAFHDDMIETAFSITPLDYIIRT